MSEFVLHLSLPSLVHQLFIRKLSYVGFEISFLYPKAISFIECKVLYVDITQ